MNLRELAALRYSVRKFSARPVEEAALRDILETAALAPTACNLQPQRILVLNEPGQLEKLKGCTNSHFNAPLALLVCADMREDQVWRRREDGACAAEVDCAIVGTHLMLRAAELGLGSCWVMAFDPAALRKAYAIPAHLDPVALFPMGYPADNAKPAHLHEKRKPIEETTYWNRFGGET